MVAYITVLSRCVQCTLDILRSISQNNSGKTPIARPLGRELIVFREFLVCYTVLRGYLCDVTKDYMVAYITVLSRCVQCTLDILRSISQNNSGKTPIVRPLGRELIVFREFLVCYTVPRYIDSV